jgi:hypothetical protein
MSQIEIIISIAIIVGMPILLIYITSRPVLFVRTRMGALIIGVLFISYALLS